MHTFCSPSALARDDGRLIHDQSLALAGDSSTPPGSPCSIVAPLERLSLVLPFWNHSGGHAPLRDQPIFADQASGPRLSHTRYPTACRIRTCFRDSRRRAVAEGGWERDKTSQAMSAARQPPKWTGRERRTPSPRACYVSSWGNRWRFLAAADCWSLRSDNRHAAVRFR